MIEELQKHEAEVDTSYEYYQIITDFDNAIQIFREAFQNSVDEDATEIYCRVSIVQRLGREDLLIDIWDNGSGLSEENIPAFFGLAKSTKIKPDRTPTGKLGYKGHGTKIYFNAERAEIFSKPDQNKAGWGIILDDPINQINKYNRLCYSDKLDAKDCSISLPTDFETGFFVRIRNPYYFKTQSTRFMLNHLYLRDYSKWFTAFATIRPRFDESTHLSTLYLSGLNIEHFQSNWVDANKIDPMSVFVKKDSTVFEEIQMGHYFPPQRSDDKDMVKYGNSVDPSKPFSDYYSNIALEKRVYLESGIHFDFIMGIEGYETKRRYDALLTSKKKMEIDRRLQHTDAERYGLWACKGGIPIEKVDEWLIGGRGIGTYTYMHAFVDCDSFNLTANRGSVKNSDHEIVEQIKSKITDILSDRKLQEKIREREEWEKFQRTERSIKQDKEELKQRFKASEKRKHIILPNNTGVPEPSKTKSGGYSESETFMVLMKLLSYYPNLFPFNILDYNTTNGIDFVVEIDGFPKYIELKGTFQKRINHSFRHIYKFICYQLEMANGDRVKDAEELPMKLKINQEERSCQ